MTFDHNIPRNLADFNRSIHPKADKRIEAALTHIYQKQGIDPESRLGVLLRNGIFKLIVGMHHMHDAVNNLNGHLQNDHKIKSKSSIKRFFYTDYLKAFNHAAQNGQSIETQERILRIEHGRTKVVCHLLKKIQEHSGRDIRDSFKILGSLIRQSLDIYRELGNAEFNFSKNPHAHATLIAQKLAEFRQTGQMPSMAA